jgi:hypothetical protein
LSQWEHELAHDPDRHFLLTGIEHGFDIVDNITDQVQPVEINNYLSATNSQNKLKVEKIIIEGLKEGHYKVAEKPPTIVSALGAVPKQNSPDVRVIHDCSRPVGSAVNDFASSEKVKYQSVDEAVRMSTQNCYYAKVDLKNAYRSVKVKPSNTEFTGFKWQFEGDPHFTYLMDKRLPFGAKRSPMIFHRLTQSVRRIMANKGFDGIVVYLDDFLIVSETKEGCRQAFSTLLSLLRQLGFHINWKKVVDPTHCITFLGIKLDSIRRTTELPSDKLTEFHDLITDFSKRKRASKKNLQSLAGKLNWACQVVRGGRTYLRRVLDTINSLKKPCHKAKLSADFHADIQWWLQFLLVFNGKCMFPEHVSVGHVQVDACNIGSGVAFKGDWHYTNWESDWPEAQNLHINHKETLSFLIAARRWGLQWANSTIFIHTDSQCAMAMINKGTTRNALVMKCLRELFWLSAIFNFQVKAVFIPGIKNDIPDAISRLHQKGQMLRLESLLGKSVCPNSLRFHMSHPAIRSIILQIRRWLALKYN